MLAGAAFCVAAHSTMQVGVASLKTEGSDLEEGEFECGLKVAGIVLLRGPLSNIVKVCVKELGVLGCKVTPFVGITPPSLLTPPTGTARVTLCAVHVHADPTFQ